MKKKHNAEKEIKRDVKLEIRMSKEEKELWYKYAENMGISPSRLARNVLMIEAESIIHNNLTKHFAKAYMKYLEATKQTKELERIKSDNPEDDYKRY